jgi:lysophospholipase L1-like esterase
VAIGVFLLTVALILMGHTPRFGLPPVLASSSVTVAEFAVLLLTVALFYSGAILGALFTVPSTQEATLPEQRPTFLVAFRHSPLILKLSFALTLVVFMLFVVEAFSYFCVQIGFGTEGPIFGKQISGYRVFKNTPNYPVNDTDRTDSYGFVCDHPVSIEKSAGTLRVFLTGGSAMVGAIQQTGLGFEYIHRYPGAGDTCTYPVSIAGVLRDLLQAKNPGRRVEVINASYYQKAFNQSLVHYLESISRFKPDYIVNMDGFNDIPLFGRADFWDYWEETFLPEFVDLDDETHRRASATYTSLLAKLLIRRIRDKQPKTQPHATHKPPETEDECRKLYDTVRDGLLKSSSRWFQTFRHYLAVVREDDVRLVFALQPILLRKGGNKKLSPLEKRFAAHAVLDDPSFIQTYMFDDFVAAELQRLTEEKGEIFCDIGAEIRTLDEGVDFYTDYCHLTPEANRVIAKILAEKIQADLVAHAR